MGNLATILGLRAWAHLQAASSREDVSEGYSLVSLPSWKCLEVKCNMGLSQDTKHSARTPPIPSVDATEIDIANLKPLPILQLEARGHFLNCRCISSHVSMVAV